MGQAARHRSPAEIAHVAAALLSALLHAGWKGLKQTPEYPDTEPNSKFVGYEVASGIPVNAHHVWDVMEPGKNHVFYGRIWYRDIFDSERSSGFILDLTTGGIGLDGFPEYWKHTERKKPEAEKKVAIGFIGTIARQLRHMRRQARTP